jgi:hypothetical protein
MDLFKFDPVSGVSVSLANGKHIGDWKKLMWVERYREAGEFELTADADSYARKELPIGTLISHLNTEEVMIVENHELTYDGKDVSEVVITGRSFETFLEQRVIGANQDWVNQSFPPPEYVLAQNPSWLQAQELITDHISYSSLLTPADALNNVTVDTQYFGPQVPTEQRTLKRSDVYSALLSLLEIDNFGIKNYRTVEGDPGLRIVIYNGVNMSSSVAFSHSLNELESAKYLWSNKNLKNCALVSGRWAETLVTTGADVGYDRRMMLVDASDLDSTLNGVPGEPEISQLLEKMRARGRQALSAQNFVSISNAKIKNNNIRYMYRKDYDLGDLVGVEGDFNASSLMRVIEHVEIEDENEQISYPTLAEL